MKPSILTIPCLWATSLGYASSSTATLAPAIRTRGASGMSTGQILRNLARSLNGVRIEGRDVSFASNKTVLNTTWSGATLLKQGLSRGAKKRATTVGGAIEAEIVCERCYITGAASASFTIKGNISDTISNYTTAVKEEVLNITKTVFDKVGDTIIDTIGDIFTGEIFEDEYDIEFPTIDVDFDLDLSPLPGVSVSFRFEEDFELYMLLNTKLAAGATYTLNLFASKTPLGIAIGSDITAGVAVVIDLILDVNAAIDISSGFHLKLDKGVGFELNMFSSNVSDITFPGGQFEFLPVTIISEGVVLRGVLRIALKAGLEFDTGGIASVLDKTPFNFESGLVAEVFANVAEFVTNVTGPALSSANARPSSNNSCDLEVVEAYQFALGAAAGATVAVGFQTWGPMPSTTIPIFYTTLASACARRRTGSPVPPASPSATSSSSSSPTSSSRGFLGVFDRAAAPTALLEARQTRLTTTTLTSTAVFTGQSCRSSGVINCPASLQVSSTYKSVITLVTAVASGVTPTFPVTKVASVASPVPFGTGARKMISSSGVPTSFVPGPTGAAGDVKAWLDRDTGGVSNKVVLGLAVGLGVPALALIIGAIVYCSKRRRYAPVASNAPSSMVLNAERTPPFAPKTYDKPVVRVYER